jgi:hypothetical protein
MDAETWPEKHWLELLLYCRCELEAVGILVEVVLLESRAAAAEVEAVPAVESLNREAAPLLVALAVLLTEAL